MQNFRNHIFPVFIGAAIMIMLLPACEQRYWYRIKFDGRIPQKKGSYHVRVINRSPDLISRDLEESVKKRCIQRLSKKGFTESEADNPDYSFDITFKICTYKVKGNMVLNEDGSLHRINNNYRGAYMDRTIDTSKQSVTHEIAMRYSLVQPKKKKLLWCDSTAIYFFKAGKLDIRRCRQITAYTMKNFQ